VLKLAAEHFASIAALLMALLVIFIFPHVFDEYTLLQLTVYIVMSILALSLGFMWGVGGILSFGHAAFFGLGSYAYAIAAINFGDTTGAVLLAILVPAAFAAILGYLLFYGRIGDVYLAAITLSVTLIFFNLVNSTSGPEYKVGKAAIGGFNGIPAIPQLNLPGNPEVVISTTQLFCLCVVVLAFVYVGLRFLIASDFGRVVRAIRSNEKRAELLGYDTRKYKLLTFMIGGALAGLAGCLFANWGGYASPTIFAVGQSVQIIIWVVVGGLGSLLGSVVGCFLIQWLTSYISGLNTLNSYLILGVILTFFVLVLPEGIVPSLQRWLGGKRGGAQAEKTNTQPSTSEIQDTLSERVREVA